jgi:PBP1b-binding outer membrane lipoprotein LpoB
MKKYLSLFTISFATVLISGCFSSGPKVKVEDKTKKEVVKKVKEKVKKEVIKKAKESLNAEKKDKAQMPPESKLIDKVIEEKVIIEDTPSKQQIESVD